MHEILNTTINLWITNSVVNIFEILLICINVLEMDSLYSIIVIIQL